MIPNFKRDQASDTSKFQVTTVPGRKLHFTKMHGLGNDFMVIDGVRHVIEINNELIHSWANRHTGIGFDQLLLVESPDSQNMDFRYRIFNADGGEVEQCGNGARCFARFIREQGLSDKDVLDVETRSGPIQLRIRSDDQVTVDMGIPGLEPGDLPFIAGDRQPFYELDVAGEAVTLGAVSMGNPHAVVRVKDINQAPVDTVGPLIESHARFPERVNAGFLQIVDRHHGRLRVFERGVGETLACGTGACAAMVAGRLWGEFDDKVEINLPGGVLVIEWHGEGQAVLMTGPATTVYTGEVSY